MLKLRKSHPGKTAKRMVIGSTRKTTGTIIAISFLPPLPLPRGSVIRLRFTVLHQVPPALLADVLGLCAQDVSQWGAALDGDDDAVDEPRKGGEAGAVGQALQRRREVGAGAGVAETAAEFVGEGAIGEAAYAFERADCALAGAHGQRK